MTTPNAAAALERIEHYACTLRLHSDVGIAGAMAHKISDELLDIIAEQRASIAQQGEAARVCCITPGMGRAELDFAGDLPAFVDLGLSVYVSTHPAAVDSALRSLLWNVVDNLNDTPVNEDWARRTADKLTAALLPATSDGENNGQA